MTRLEISLQLRNGGCCASAPEEKKADSLKAQEEKKKRQEENERRAKALGLVLSRREQQRIHDEQEERKQPQEKEEEREEEEEKEQEEEEEEQEEFPRLVLRGSLLKAYENFVLGQGTLSPDQIESLKAITVIDDNFINGRRDPRFQNITSIDLKFFVSVRKIGNFCLFRCSSLRYFDSDGVFFSQVYSVGNSFLAECSSLVSVDLRSLRNLKYVKTHFIARCPSLRDVTNLRDFSTSLQSVGECFLHQCPKLQLDLTPLAWISEDKIYDFELRHILKKLRNNNYVENPEEKPLAAAAVEVQAPPNFEKF